MHTFAHQDNDVLCTAKSASEEITRIYAKPSGQPHDPAIDRDTFETSIQSLDLVKNSAEGTVLYAVVYESPDQNILLVETTIDAACATFDSTVGDDWEDDEGQMRPRLLPQIQAAIAEFKANPTYTRLICDDWNCLEIYPVTVSTAEPAVDENDERVIHARSHLSMSSNPTAKTFEFFLYSGDLKSPDFHTTRTAVADYDWDLKQVVFLWDQIPLVRRYFPDLAMFTRCAEKLIARA